MADLADLQPFSIFDLGTMRIPPIYHNILHAICDYIRLSAP